MAIQKRASSGRVAATINITPLIDILLVLLVIFMTAASTTSTVLETEVPQASGPRVESLEPPIIVSVDGKGAVEINHTTLDGMLKPRLEDILRLRRDRTVFVRADTGLRFETVAHVIDESRAAGASRIGLMTD